MAKHKIEWNKVTWYSWVAAIVIFVGTFWIGFSLGAAYGSAKTALEIAENNLTMPPTPISGAAVPGGPTAGLAPQSENVINNVVYACPDGKSIHAVFYTSNAVKLDLSDGRSMTLPQTISASGARYANGDESFVFWNKGNGAFIEENGTTTYQNCEIGPSGK